MEGSSPSNGSSGRGGSRSMVVGSSFIDFVFKSVVEPRPSFTNFALYPVTASILDPDELFASRYFPFQPYRTLEVL